MGKNNTKSLDKTLSSMHLVSLDDHALETAQKRVWNHISHSIKAIESFNPTQENMPELVRTSFWVRRGKALVTFSVLSLALVVMATTTVYFYSKNRSGSTLV